MIHVSETGQGAKVLVVDDEANIRELLSVSLKFQGYEVETAAGGPEAIDRCRNFKPDVLILDVMMPGMDGFGLLRRRFIRLLRLRLGRGLVYRRFRIFVFIFIFIVEVVHWNGLLIVYCLYCRFAVWQFVENNVNIL